jgi:hypothetical protein
VSAGAGRLRHHLLGGAYIAAKVISYINPTIWYKMMGLMLMICIILCIFALNNNVLNSEKDEENTLYSPVTISHCSIRYMAVQTIELTFLCCH